MCRRQSTSSRMRGLAKSTQVLWTNFSVHRTSYRIQLLSRLARSSSVLFSGRMGCHTVFALPAVPSTASSLDSTPTNGQRITLQPNLSATTRPTLYMSFPVLVAFHLASICELLVQLNTDGSRTPPSAKTPQGITFLENAHYRPPLPPFSDDGGLC